MTISAPLAPAPARPAVPAPVPRLRRLRYEPDPDEPAGGTTPGPPVVPPVTEDLHGTGPLRRRAQLVLRLALEVLDGRRPAAHLAPHLEPSALRYLRAARARRPSARQPSRLTSLHVGRPCPDAVELAAVFRTGERAHALAARFEGPADEPQRWRCVTLRLA